MKTNLTATPLDGLLVVNIEYFEDERGFFMESWNYRDLEASGLAVKFKQENHSSSERNVLRGLHYQDMNAPTGKLIRCTVGTIFDVAVDLRASSATFGRWHSVELSADNKIQLWVPVGFAHGFMTMTDRAEVQYQQTDFYMPKFESGIQWNDPDIGVNWPTPNPILSQRDKKQPSFREYRKNPAFE